MSCYIYFDTSYNYKKQKQEKLSFRLLMSHFNPLYYLQLEKERRYMLITIGEKYKYQ